MNIVPPSKKELKELFLELKEHEYKGVKGVVKIDGPAPGATLAISIFTHGNEPSGLAVLWYLLKNNRLLNILSNGSIIFVVNNLKAADAYFSASTKEKKRKARLIDINFNRLPKDALRNKDIDCYEIKRLHEIYPIIQEADVCFDIHSTEQESDPMIIFPYKDNLFEYVRSFPISKLLSNIANHQIGVPINYFYGGVERKIPLVTIESGSHESQASFKTAITCTLELMKNIQLSKAKPQNPRNVKTRNKYTHFEVCGSIIFPDKSYELKKPLAMFEKIKKGQVIGIGNGKEIISPVNGHAVMAPKGTIPANYSEEVIFITEPKEELYI